MKKTIKIVALLMMFIGFISFSHSSIYAKNDTSKVDLKSFKDYEGAFKNQYYRFNKKTKVYVNFSSKKDSRNIYKTVTLPKGTIASVESSSDNPKYYVFNYGTLELSYHAKRKAFSPKLYGQGNVEMKIKRSSNRLTKIKTPSYAFKYGNGNFIPGGLKAIHKLPKRDDNNYFKITSDGWMEYYRYHYRKYPQISEFSVLDNEKYSEVFYNDKPSAAAKIKKTVKIKNKTYYYMNHKMPNLKMNKAKNKKIAKYYLVVKNHHTPVSYEDFAYGDDMAMSSIYTIGNKPFYMVIGQGFN